jgi:hypothetical protein
VAGSDQKWFHKVLTFHQKYAVLVLIKAKTYQYHIYHALDMRQSGIKCGPTIDSRLTVSYTWLAGFKDITGHEIKKMSSRH